MEATVAFLDEKLALMDRKAAMKHRSWCTYRDDIFGSPTSDFCSCDLHERKQAVQDEIDRLQAVGRDGG